MASHDSYHIFIFVFNDSNVFSHITWTIYLKFPKLVCELSKMYKWLNVGHIVDDRTMKIFTCWILFYVCKPITYNTMVEKENKGEGVRGHDSVIRKCISSHNVHDFTRVYWNELLKLTQTSDVVVLLKRKKLCSYGIFIRGHASRNTCQAGSVNLLVLTKYTLL